ncbi:MAG: 23S rRNA (adenine2503-C2)-methyltransferase [Candidatus Magnetoglobus multicellularis str. Araruama]|uniref:23S rRNA (Adenine2503-C2)-methyltransferase n=1 Tax=Candidatus Magnetoglobus multicellularis str. Araruama TaxID=890399 RepID=A0A1V1P958_9BACT|nr:MAG: 23S rRNA (adenine2503-C2)-methyltransferase [Candidatus Magnetoglobus multicellularis str. Araruama]
MMSNKIPILAMTSDDLTQRLNQQFCKGKYHAKAIMREIYLHGNWDLSKVDAFSLSGSLAREITKAIDILTLPVEKKQVDGNVIKWTGRLTDGNCIESVIIPMLHHHTLCISSQVGCRMGCQFCQTGQMGFVRQLTAEEIVAQVYTSIFYLNAIIRNIVFMGMGEPLDNIEAVIQAIKVLTDPHGFNFPKKYITLSTAGHVPGIQKLAKCGLKAMHLAISINAANDFLRNQLMPINRKYPLQMLQDCLVNYPLKSKGVLFIEYVLIKGINDRQTDVDQLADFVAPLRVRVNVIPYNAQKNAIFKTPSPEEFDQFCNGLIQKKYMCVNAPQKGRV